MVPIFRSVSGLQSVARFARRGTADAAVALDHDSDPDQADHRPAGPGRPERPPSTREQQLEQGLLRVESVLGLVEDRRPRAVKDVGGDLVAGVGR
jgi:hypothetical protein